MDYEVQYKKGVENKAADALSKQLESGNASLPQDTGQLLAIRASFTTWMQEVTSSYEGDSQAIDLITQLTVDLRGPNL